MPVLLSGAGADMPALTLWQNNAYLAGRIGHARLLVRTAPSEGATFGDAARLQAGEHQLYEFVDVGGCRPFAGTQRAVHSQLSTALE